MNRYPLGDPYTSVWSGGDLDAQWRALGELIADRPPGPPSACGTTRAGRPTAASGRCIGDRVTCLAGRQTAWHVVR